MKEIKIEIFHAASNVDKWSEYTHGHASVLDQFGVKNLNSFKSTPCEHPQEYVLTGRNMDGALMGGIRIQLYNSAFKLPVVQAMEGLDGRVNDLMMMDVDKGIAELCGLWISRDHGRHGLAHYLIRAAIAYCPLLNAGIIYGISSPFAINIFLVLGYVVMEGVGDRGTYLYPTKDFLSTMVVVPNTYTLEYAEQMHRDVMFFLRTNPICSLSHIHRETTCLVHYNLLLS